MNRLGKIAPTDQRSIDEANAAEHRATIDLLLLEADIQRQRQQSRLDSLQARAGILVTAAIVSGGLQATAPSPIHWYILGLVFAAAALVSSLVVVLPSRGTENGLNEMLTELWQTLPNMAALTFLERKKEILLDEELAFKPIARFLLWGYIALALSILFLVLQHVWGVILW